VIRIDVPDDILLEIFLLFLYEHEEDGDRGMAIAGSRVSTMEEPRFCVSTSPESAALLYTQNTRKGPTGHLGSLAPRR
jgi:hypothetical protein